MLECSQVTVTGLWGRMGHKRVENPQEEPVLQRVLELVALQVLRQGVRSSRMVQGLR